MQNWSTLHKGVQSILKKYEPSEECSRFLDLSQQMECCLVDCVEARADRKTRDLIANVTGRDIAIRSVINHTHTTRRFASFLSFRESTLPTHHSQFGRSAVRAQLRSLWLCVLPPISVQPPISMRLVLVVGLLLATMGDVRASIADCDRDVVQYTTEEMVRPRKQYFCVYCAVIKCITGQ